MFSIWDELNFLDGFVVLFHSLEQFAGSGVPQTDVIADVPENPLSIIVPTFGWSLNALPPLHRRWGAWLTICHLARQADTHQDACFEQDAEHLSVPMLNLVHLSRSLLVMPLDQTITFELSRSGSVRQEHHSIRLSGYPCFRIDQCHFHLTLCPYCCQH